MTVTLEQVQNAKTREALQALNKAATRASRDLLVALMANTVSRAEANKASAAADKVLREINKRMREFERLGH